MQIKQITFLLVDYLLKKSLPLSVGKSPKSRPLRPLTSLGRGMCLFEDTLMCDLVLLPLAEPEKGVGDMVLGKGKR